MGFEPFILPKKTPTQATESTSGQSRDEKVRALAVLLHSRGLTSSLTDAKRLAEGMVDVEKKILSQTPQTSTGIAKDAAAPINNIQSNGSHPHMPAKAPAEQYRANWDERFEKFVARTAPIKEEYHRSPVPVAPTQVATEVKTNPETIIVVEETVMPTVTQESQSAQQPQLIQQSSSQNTNIQTIPIMTKSIVYGRETPREISSIPHTSRSKQIFFEDAPPITQARGYNGPQPQSVEFVSQKLDAFKKQQEQKQEEKITVQEEKPQELVVEKIEIEQTPEMTIVDKTSISPSEKTEEEIVIVQDIDDKDFLEIISEQKEEQIEKPMHKVEEPQTWHSTTRQDAPTAHATIVSEVEKPVEVETQRQTQPETTTPQEKKPSQDLPKIDIFEFFKKKG